MDTIDITVKHFSSRFITYLRQLLSNNIINNISFQHVQYLDQDLVAYSRKYKDIDALLVISKIIDEYKKIVAAFFRHSAITSYSQAQFYQIFGVSFTFYLNINTHSRDPRGCNMEIN